MVKEYEILVLYDTDKMFTSSENVWSWSLEYIYLKKGLKWQQMSVWQIVYKKKKKRNSIKVYIHLPAKFFPCHSSLLQHHAENTDRKG